MKYDPGLSDILADTNPLDSQIDIPMLSGSQTPSQRPLTLLTAGHAPATPADAPALMSMGFETPLSTSSSTGSLHSTAYKVSITMDCTRGQLDAVLVQLGGIGSGLTIKIDSKS